MTRLVVLGAGSLGGFFAHHLALGGADVHVVDLWEEHVNAIRANGLQLQIGETVITSPVRQATTRAAEVGVVDVVVLFVKTNATRAALTSAKPMVGPKTVLVTLQNGLGNAEVIRELYPKQTVLYGLTTLTADLLAPGRVAPRSTESGVTDVWTLDPSNPEPVRQFVDLLNRGGIAACVAPDIDLSIWRKLVVNCALNGLCAITDLTCGQLCAQPEIWPLLDRIADEVSALARARGVPLETTAAREFLRKVAKASAAHYPSMVFDLRKKRPTEIDSFNNAIVRGCAALGLDASANQTVVALVKSVEANFSTVRD
jgi:2-dehydropantoate 2-reductase